MANKPYLINSISEQHRLLSLPKPEHPLVSLIDFSEVREGSGTLPGNFMMNFYTIAIKKGFKGKLKYGQHYYDFDEGVMSFISPGQVLSQVAAEDSPLSGWLLMIHPDFIRSYPLAKTIKNYGFFSYDLNEALHLSEKEENLVAGIMKNIRQEYLSVIDSFSQDVIISHIELLLNYANRFYNRQFITRKHVNNDLLINLEALLKDYFTGNLVQQQGLPTVQYVAQALNLSPSYLSDMLRSLTGQNAQQHIHGKLIEKAKESLSTTALTVSEIAYQLGFEHPQSFSKFFKNKTDCSPLEYRGSFN
jgi:AraC family transcriptional regulator, transcriptional activator of pobA